MKTDGDSDRGGRNHALPKDAGYGRSSSRRVLAHGQGRCLQNTASNMPLASRPPRQCEDISQKPSCRGKQKFMHSFLRTPTQTLPSIVTVQFAPNTDYKFICIMNFSNFDGPSLPRSIIDPLSQRDSQLYRQQYLFLCDTIAIYVTLLPK